MFEFGKIFINIVFSLGLFFNAALFIPQAITLFKKKNSSGLSLFTFAGFNVMQLFTVLHGLIEKDYILAIGFGLSFITCSIVTLLILRYRK